MLSILAVLVASTSLQAQSPCVSIDGPVHETELVRVRLASHIQLPAVVVIERLRDLAGAPIVDTTIERGVEPGEELWFRFSVARASYRLTVANASCAQVTLQALEARVASRPLSGHAIVGLTDGLGVQFGAALWIKRAGIAGSVIPLVPGDGTFTADLELAYRANRGITGIGMRWREGRDRGDLRETVGYVHTSLELPGVTMPILPSRGGWLKLPQASGWIGVEFRPAKKVQSEQWQWAREFGVRLQLRWPRGRLFGT